METYGNWQHEFRVSGQVGYVAVQRDFFLGCAGLTDGQRHAEDGVGSKLCCLTNQATTLSISIKCGKSVCEEKLKER